MKFYIADAFTDTLFGGNPAGVVLLGEKDDFPPEKIMQKTAAELRYSETAFIKQRSAQAFQIRYFTPAAEVDLCGHATIAAFSCLLEAGLVREGETCVNRTLAGDLKIEIQRGFIMMQMGAPKQLAVIEEAASLAELYEMMGISCEPTDAAPAANPAGDSQRLLPMLISTGLPDIIMPVASREQLAAISPDFPRLSELSERYHVTGVHAFTLDRQSPDITAHCRNFAPLYDIDEEAATGTANGALTYYLLRHGLIDRQQQCVFLQGEAMGRPSRILSRAGASDIQVGGGAAILAQGEIML